MIVWRVAEADHRQLHAGEELVARLQRDDGADERGDEGGERHGVDADHPHLMEHLAEPGARLGQAASDVAHEERAQPDLPEDAS